MLHFFHKKENLFLSEKMIISFSLSILFVCIIEFIFAIIKIDFSYSIWFLIIIQFILLISIIKI